MRCHRCGDVEVLVGVAVFIGPSTAELEEILILGVRRKRGTSPARRQGSFSCSGDVRQNQQLLTRPVTTGVVPVKSMVTFAGTSFM
jgi:hypothetical protein